MSSAREFAEFLCEQLQPLGPVEARRMFGGCGLFLDGLMFAIVVDDTLYFKTDDTSRAAYAQEGLGPFTYGTKNGDKVIMGYWKAPSRCLDDADELLTWARPAVTVARAKAAEKSKPKPKRTTAARKPPRKA